MDENKPSRPERNNKRSYWITAILIVLIVGMILILGRDKIFNTAVTWNKNELNTYLRLDSVDSTSKSVYVATANVSQNYRATTVSGTAMYTESKTMFKYTVTIENDDWNVKDISYQKFSYSKNAEGQKTISYSTEIGSWADIFENRVDEWNNTDALQGTYGSGYYKVADAFQTSVWDTWGPVILQLVFLVILGYVFYRMVGGSGGANRQAMDFNKSPARRENHSKVRFADVAGCDEEKAEMQELVEYLKNPKKYSVFGAKLPKGCLLVGPPGTGKTLLAKAVAGEAGVPFFSISGSDFVEMFVGVGAGRVRDLFKKAKASAPCIIFIDEIDAVGRQRGAGLGGGNDEREQTLNQLLVEMDGFEFNSGVLVIAATNRDDVLDPALLRPGRFDRIITVSNPDAVGREAIFRVHAEGKKVDPSVDFKALAKRTVGFSGADIANIMNEAAILAVRFHKDAITISEIDEAIDRRIAGPAKNGKRMSDMERKRVAYHEAGHAVIGLVLPDSDKVQKITIIPRGQTGGHVLMTPETDKFLLTKKELLAEITGLLGGRVSEEVFLDDITTGAENDIQRATRLARMMVTEYGMSDLGPIQYESDTGSVFLGRDYTNSQKNFSSEIAYEIDKAVRKIIDEAHEQAVKILKENEDKVKLIAETLLENETITAEQIDQLLKDGTLPTRQIQKPVEEIKDADKSDKDDHEVVEGEVVDNDK